MRLRKEEEEGLQDSGGGKTPRLLVLGQDKDVKAVEAAATVATVATVEEESLVFQSSRVSVLTSCLCRCSNASRL
jgi:hypothetical protein